MSERTTFSHDGISDAVRIYTELVTAVSAAKALIQVGERERALEIISQVPLTFVVSPSGCFVNTETRLEPRT